MAPLPRRQPIEDCSCAAEERVLGAGGMLHDGYICSISWALETVCIVIHESYRTE